MKKINIGFYVLYSSSFAAKNLFERLRDSDWCEVKIVVCPDICRGKENEELTLKKETEYLTNRYGKEYVICSYDYKKNAYVDFSETFNAISISNPYDELTHKYYTSNYLRNEKGIPLFYLDYGYQGRLKYSMELFEMESYKNFYRIFCDNNETLEMAKEISNHYEDSISVSGCSKMDSLFNAKKINFDKKFIKTILICPHHTVREWKLQISTFLAYSDFYIELFKKYSNILFVFRPHPLLFTTLREDDLWGNQKCDEYLNKINSFENVIYSTEGDYFDYFVTSDAMIHDCGSFVAEYIYTKKPQLYLLKNEESKNQFTDFGKDMLKVNYEGYNQNDIIDFIENVVLKNDDKLELEREKFSRQIMVNYPYATIFIESVLKENLTKKDFFEDYKKSIKKKKNPLISVCIPSYNHERYVQQTINSIISQTYQSLELIIIDDGSSDSTYEKILELKDICEKRFVRVAIEKQENQGTCDTFNKLYSYSQGDFVFVIASDDYAAPSCIETLYSNFDSEETVMVVGDNYIIDSESNLISWDESQNIIKYGEGYNTFFSYLAKDNVNRYNPNYFGTYESLIDGNYITNGQLVRKSAFDKTGGYKYDAPLEDWYMNLQLSKIGKLKFVNSPLFYYRWHESNSIKQLEKMWYFTFKTKCYEEQNVLKSGNIDYINIYHRNISFFSDYLKLKHYFQVYFDYGMGFNEKDSTIIQYNPYQRNWFRVSLDGDKIRSLRIDPDNRALGFKIEYIKFNKRNGESFFYDAKLISSNAKIISDDIYIFETDDPNLNFTNFDCNGLDEFEIKFEWMPLEKIVSLQNSIIDDQKKRNVICNSMLEDQKSECSRYSSMIEQNNNVILSLHSELKSIYSSKSWRITKPLRFIYRFLRGK
ncbi:glycosyltransferase [Treponema sp.]|uniref:glycosyltransferase n=1 Tax=Treponema sp. TaxID=166 RepID=UPI00298D9321|nr:glycosyltransferase [Treponema sp.]MCQ2241402.1 glycosyltransferase [Treponema sp.]